MGRVYQLNLFMFFVCFMSITISKIQQKYTIMIWLSFHLIFVNQQYMSFSLSQSYEKFSQLREQLRKIAGPHNKQSVSSKANKPQYEEFSHGKGMIQAVSPQKIKTQETQRKRGKENQRKENCLEVKQGSKTNNVILLRKKQQTLDEINRLLQLKRSYLQEIQHQLKHQNTKMTPIDTYFKQSLQQTPKSSKLKAPDLYQIRQAKQRLKHQSTRHPL